MSITTGKVAAIKLNVPKTSSGGKSYTAHLLKLSTSEGEEVFTISSKMPPAKYVEKLKVGDDVTITTGGQFNSVVKVSNNSFKKSFGDSSSGSGYKKKEYKDNTQGMIKGNSVSNGVALAIARFGKGVTIEQVEIAAREVLELHKRLDNEDTPIFSTSGVNEATVFDDQADADPFSDVSEDIDF